MKNIFRLIRPTHWIKNFFVFMPLFFGGAITDISMLTNAVIAFIAFSFIASAIYCYNDIIDVEDDRRHSVKRHRPIASGAVSVSAAYLIMIVMILISISTAMLAGSRWCSLATVIAIYFLMEIAYCRILKLYAIVDVIILSAGFVLRILAGSVATGIIPSQWLVLMTFLLTLLLALAKRRDDVLRMNRTGEAPRHNTHRYNMTFINQSITVTASVTLVCYIMYSLSPEVVARTRFEYLYLTTVFVIAGLLRYMQLTAVDQRSGDPTKLLTEDRFLQITIALWALSFLIILYIL